MSSSRKEQAKSLEYIRTPIYDSDLETVLKNNADTADLIDGGLVLDGKVLPVVVVNKRPLVGWDTTDFSTYSIAASSHLHVTYSGLYQINSVGGNCTVIHTYGVNDYVVANIPAYNVLNAQVPTLCYLISYDRIVNNDAVNPCLIQVYYINCDN